MIYFDFEYRNPFTKEEIILVTLEDTKLKTGPFQFDLRDELGRSQMLDFFNLKKKAAWCCFNGLADLTCLLSLGCDIRDIIFIDAMTESRMITLSHEDYLSHERSLLSTLKTLQLKGDYPGYAQDVENKDNIRNLILDNSSYTPEQWRTICDYAIEDVIVLPDILSKVAEIHKTSRDGVSLDHMIKRGDYSKISTLLNYKSKGFPVDVDRLEAIYSNKQRIFEALAVEINNKYSNEDKPLYVYKKKNKEEVGIWTFNQTGFEWLIREKLEIKDWKKTPSGKLVLTKDYLEERCKEIPFLDGLRRTRNTIDALKGTDYRTLLKEGYIKPSPVIFNQKTGRNTPMPKSGFLLNLTPWLRSALIRPAPGKAFIGIDWSQQEIGIAAILSGDERMKQIYQSSDPYLELAKMAGAAPQGATKKTHGSVRQNFKAVQLGIGYGKGVKSLTLDVWANNLDTEGKPTLTIEAAEAKANEIYKWHKKHFCVYWKWIGRNKELAMVNGYIASRDHWIAYCGKMTRPTQIQNFPMQANGAYMLREAMKHVLAEDLELVCPLHDALYVQCNIEEASVVAEKLGQCMDKASATVLDGFVLRRDEAKINTHEEPYYDERGFELYEVITGLLGEVMYHPEHERLKNKAN